MAIHYNNSDSQRKYDNRVYFDKHIRLLSERQTRWMQSYLASEVSVNFKDIGSTDQNEQLVNKLARHEDFRSIVEKSYSKMSLDLVPETYFEWLIDNLRGQIFALNILYSEYKYDTFDRSSSNLIGEIYLFFDNKNNTAHINNKIILLNNIEQRWYTIFEKDNYSKWLDINNKEQIKWTRDYLKKDKVYSNLIRDRVSHKEIRSISLASLDLIDYPIYNEAKNSYISHISTDRKERIIDKMKKAWSQQKYRDSGKTKKPYHLPLTKQSKGRLDKMALVQDTTATAILDILINSAYESDYIDEYGKDKY